MRAGTHVTIQTHSDILGSGDIAATAAGGSIDLDLNPFDVVNLESDGFRSDFTGSLVTSDQPVLVFSGGECGDVPADSSRDARKCCCDHLEEQLAPEQAFGRVFAAVQTPLRTAALAEAGADVLPLSEEPEVWRLLSAAETTCRTTLAPPLDEIQLTAGEARIEASADFLVECDAAVQLALTRRVRGHFNYFGVSGNARSLRALATFTLRAWFKWLNRRSQRASLTWERFEDLLRDFPLPVPRVVVNIWRGAR